MSLKARINAVKKHAKKNTTPSGQALIKPNPDEPKSGCLWCPLFPFNHDFSAFGSMYQRDAEKIISKEKEPHVIRNRGVSERPWKKVRVLFVGEAPGAQENVKGLPFVGRAGDLVRLATTEALDLKPEEYAFTNLLGCQPPRNRNPRKADITCCSYELIREIKARQPEVIVVLGNFSLEFLTGQKGITTFAGHVLKSTHPEWKDKPVLACLHPAFVLRFDYYTEKFGETFGKLHEYLTGEYTPPAGPGEYKTLTSLPAVKKLLLHFRKAKKITFDTECGSLTPFQDEFPALLCMSFSNQAGAAYTVPYDHEESPWREGGPKAHERKALCSMLRNFFMDESIPKVAQNEKFDRKQIRHSLGCRVKGLLRDTMLTHLVLNEQRGTHGLKNLAYAYTGMGGYEKPLEAYIKSHKAANPEKGGSYANIPGKLLFPYCGMDADVTYRVDDGLIAEAEYQEDVRLRNLAEVFLPQLSVALSDVEYAGVQVDPAIVRKLDKEYTAKMKDFQKKIAKLPRVRSFVAKQIKAGKTGKKKAEPFKFNPGSVQQLRPVLFGYYNLKPIEMTPAGFKLLTSRYARIAAEQKKKKGGKVPKFQDIIDAAVANKEWQWFTTDVNTLHEYERQGNDLAPLIIKYREAATIYDTFIKPLLDRLDPDGRVHSSLIPHGTVCVVGSTLVWTEKGEVPIQSLVQGRTVGFEAPPPVRVWDGQQWRRPVAAFYAGVRPTIRIQTDDSGVVEGTYEHPLLTPNGWMRLRAIRVGDVLFRYRPDGRLDRVRVIRVSYREAETFDLTMEMPDVQNSVPFVRQDVSPVTTARPYGTRDDVGGILREIPRVAKALHSVEHPQEAPSDYDGATQRPGFSRTCATSICSEREAVSYVLAGTQEQRASPQAAACFDCRTTADRPEFLAQGPCGTEAGVQSQARSDHGADSQRYILGEVRKQEASVSEDSGVEHIRADGSEIPEWIRARAYGTHACRCAVRRERSVLAGITGRYSYQPGLQSDREEEGHRSIRGALASAERRARAYQKVGIFGPSVPSDLAEGLDEGSGWHYASSNTVPCRLTHAFVTNRFVSHNTGRLASADPNNQNIPPSAKPVYISRYGDEGVILQADYSQMELRIAACWFKSQKMIDAYKKGIDLHAQTAADIDHKALEAFLKLTASERKEKRTRAKRVNFGTMYGIGPPGLVGTLKKEGIHVTVEETTNLIEQFFAVRPGLKAGMDATKEEAAENGFLRSFTGRKRRLPEVFSVHNAIKARALRQCINFPIQSGASDMTLMALVLIHRILRSEGFKSEIVLTVHDSIVFDCHVDEVLEVAKIAKDVMEHMPELSDEVLPGIDWAWLKVPIVADIEAGHNWGSLVGFDPRVVEEGQKSTKKMYKKNEKDQIEIDREPINIDELWEQMEFKAQKVA